MSPPDTRPFAGRRPIRLNASVVFPDPDSPTNPTERPASNEKGADETARTGWPPCLYSTLRFSTDKSPGMLGTVPRAIGVELPLECVTDHGERQYEEKDAEPRRNDVPPGAAAGCA